MEDQERRRVFTEKLTTHPKEKSNFLAHLLFCWQIPVLLRGLKKELTEDDLYKPLEECDSKKLGDKLELAWSEERSRRKKPSLIRALARIFGKELAIYGVVYFPVDLLFLTMQPYCIAQLLEYYTAKENYVSRKQAYIYASAIIILFLVRLVVLHYTIMQLNVFGIKIRTACSSLIYRHTLQMTKSSFEKITTGHLINLLSNDVNTFDQAFAYIHFLWIGPLEFILMAFYIDFGFGHTPLIGAALLLVSVFVQLYLMKKMTTFKTEGARRTDHRIRLMNDLICGIHTIKMYTWEKPFAQLIKSARRSELDQQLLTNKIRILFTTLRNHVAKISVVSSLILAIGTGVVLSSKYLFSLIRIFDIFRITLGGLLPLALIQLVGVIVALRRIENFLLHTHQKEEKILHFEQGVSLKNVSVAWEKDTLTKINLVARPGELVGVVGPAGSGKSTILRIILKEVEIKNGSLEVGGSISYSSQEAWIFPSSVRQNILFGQNYDSEKYRKIVKLCCLEEDFRLFPHGDESMVGERGIMLSGGQKARVNLARAIYRDADIYLLDDPLSAVDAKVAKEIFENCILSYLRSKCVILVTHQIQFCKKFDRVYVVESGKLIESENCVENFDVSGDKIEEERLEMIKEPPTEIKEHRTFGTSDWKNFGFYCGAAGHWSFTCLVVFLFVLYTFLATSLNYLIIFVTFTPDNFFYVYISLSLLQLLIYYIASYCLVKFSMKASKNLHNNMLERIIHSTINFFNYHPSGQILNRFSRDMACIDDAFPDTILSYITILLSFIGAITLIIIINYWMVFPTLCLVGLVLIYNYIYQPTNKSIKRTEGTTRSLVFTHLSSTLQGLTTIKSSNAQKILTDEFDNYLNTHIAAVYNHTTTSAAYSFWIDLTCVIYCALVIFSFFFWDLEETYVGYIGLAITQSTVFSETVQYGMKVYAILTAQVTSVERVIEYTKLETETKDGCQVPEAWPKTGKIVYDSVGLRYSDAGPLVLQNVSFVINDGEKIGIVGRTGVGKTSLISVLFRLYSFEGSISIDGFDIKSIPLNKLRSQISIIPQEPVLFLGTLRKNIDPFDEFDDGQIWRALEELEMKGMISNLDSMVLEKGSNFSVGQRQLLCLVRAMLRNNKIVVLDEATASVDWKTDELIQRTVRRKFDKCTVLIIAHRLNTVLDSDRILVMDGGRVVEFDSPRELLQNRDGFLYSYVRESGDKVIQGWLQKH